MNKNIIIVISIFISFAFFGFAFAVCDVSNTSSCDRSCQTNSDCKLNSCGCYNKNELITNNSNLALLCADIGNCICKNNQCAGSKAVATATCANAGEEADLHGANWGGKDKCCQGLTAVAINVEPYNGECLEKYPPYGTQFLCINCGDGICGIKENKCNCLSDCINSTACLKEGEIGICGQDQCCSGLKEECMQTATVGSIAKVVCTKCSGNNCNNKLGVTTKTTIDIFTEKKEDKTKLMAEISNGKKAEIKVMPETASETAIERLGLKVCSQDNNCTIELKETGKGEKAKPVYEVQAIREYRILWIFKVKSTVTAEISAENGEVLMVKKPWWSFLAW